MLINLFDIDKMFKLTPVQGHKVKGQSQIYPISLKKKRVSTINHEPMIEYCFIVLGEKAFDLDDTYYG